MIPYGREDTLKSLDTRKKDVRGEVEHVKAATQQEKVKEQQHQQDAQTNEEQAIPE